MISKNTALIIGAGALSGLMYASLTTGHPFSLIFVFFSLLPLFVVGLAFGLTSVLAAIAAGIVVSAAVGGPFRIFFGAPGYLLLGAVPAGVLVRQALQSRQEGGVAVWYPPGRLLTWLVGFAGVYFVAAALVFWGSPGGLAGRSNHRSMWGGRKTPSWRRKRRTRSDSWPAKFQAWRRWRGCLA